VRYGDRLSSLLVVESRPGTNQSGLNGFLRAEPHRRQRRLRRRPAGRALGSWLVTGRRTYYDLVAESFVDSNLPAFTDVQGQLSWELTPGQRLTLFALASREGTDAFFEGDRPASRGTS